MFIIEIVEFTPEYLQVTQKFLNTLLQQPVHLNKEDFKEIVASGNSHLFFMFDNEKVVAMLTVGIYRSPSGTKAWIEDVVVDDAYRGQGLGRMMVQHAVDFVKSSGVNLLMLTSSPTRIAANKLYQSLGFEKKETNVYRMIIDKPIE